MNNQILEVGSHRWLVREARSLADAEEAIAYASASGSIGSRHLENDVVTADVVRLNSDGTETQPYAGY